jgi:hypothetical protein
MARTRRQDPKNGKVENGPTRREQNGGVSSANRRTAIESGHLKRQTGAVRWALAAIPGLRAESNALWSWIAPQKQPATPASYSVMTVWRPSDPRISVRRLTLRQPHSRSHKKRPDTRRS